MNDCHLDLSAVNNFDSLVHTAVMSIRVILSLALNDIPRENKPPHPLYFRLLVLLDTLTFYWTVAI